MLGRYLNCLKNEANYTTTENGAKTHISTQSAVLDLFATIGALRYATNEDIRNRFYKAYAEDPDLATKILFYARDIRGGLGERRVFRSILKDLAEEYPSTVAKNIEYIPEFGRWDDLLCLLDGKCKRLAMEYIVKQWMKDCFSHNNDDIYRISLLAKWLPSVNTSNKETVRLAHEVIKGLGISERIYRKSLSALRKDIKIIENNLRTKDYSFDYSKQPSRAMLKYRKAFIRNDEERYTKYLEEVAAGKKKINTGTLYPYDIVGRCLKSCYAWRDGKLSATERKSLDVTWNALPDFTDGRNAMVVLDGSGSMYGNYNSNDGMKPINVAMSLAIYFAERNKGAFHNHFITFSSKPQVVQIEGNDIYEKTSYCALYDDCSNTNLEATFILLLNTAVKNHTPQSEMPETLYIISDMEFDRCSHADSTNFQFAKKIFEDAGYKLPNIVFWNVASRNTQQPVTKNEQGVALVSGASPRIFQMVISGETDPYEFMKSVILTERYECIKA